MMKTYTNLHLSTGHGKNRDPHVGTLVVDGLNTRIRNHKMYYARYNTNRGKRRPAGIIYMISLFGKRGKECQ